MQRRPNVFEVGTTLYKNHTNVLCLLGVNTSLGSACLQGNDQLRNRAKGFELLTHRCRSSIYELDVILELSLNETLDMKRILSIIME